MSSGSSKGGPPKPFLGDEELSAELDAWDDMFDNLHEVAPATPNAGPAEPAPDEAPPADIAAFDAAPEHTLEVDDDNMTLDRDLGATPVPATSEVDDWALPDDEADFSAVAEPSSKRATTSDPEDEDDGVYTSASRPNVPSPSSSAALPEDPIAPPPKPVSTPSIVRRTGPAIIRRTPPAGVETVPEGKKTPQQGYAVVDPADEFGGSTRIADSFELDARVEETRHGDARSKAPTAPPPMSFTPSAYDEPGGEPDDDYEIEIGASSGDDAGPSVPEPVARRTVANVIRRDPAKPAAPRRESEPIIEVTRAPTPAPVGEDDFSDVAAEMMAVPSPGERLTPRPPPEDEEAPVAELDAEASFSEEEPVPQIDDDNLIGTPVVSETADRPPGLMDLYPRVKRPTSVPAMHQPEPGQRAPSVAEAPEVEPALDLEAIGPDSSWPEQVAPVADHQLDEDAARMLLIYEREITTVDDDTAAAALRIEAGRLCERVGDTDRARAHYDAALLADPRATAALRGLRRIARLHGDLVEATRQLDAEIAVAGALERRPLGHYRVDLLMASGEHDLARVAVGDILDTAPSDTRALLAQLELAFLDGRADEFGRALEQLAHAVSDAQLRAAVQQARSMLASQHNDAEAAASYLAAAAESDPTSIPARLAAIRDAAAASKAPETANALLELARLVHEADPETAAALAVRAQYWAQGELAGHAAALGAAVGHGEPLVARVTAETTLALGDTTSAAAAFATWAATDAPPAERAYAAARAAELDGTHGIALWGTALQLDPDDDYAGAQLRTALVGAGQTAESIEVDQMVAADTSRERARLRAAFGLVAENALDRAIELLEEGHAARPASLAVAEALAEAYAAAGRWSDRARLLASLAETPGEQLDKDVAQVRSALAWEEAVGAAAAVPNPDPDEVQRTTAAALGAWERVAETANAPEAHAAAIVLGTRLGDKDVLGEILGRAQAAERSPWAAASIALRRARLIATDDAARADALLEEVSPDLDDPRRTVVQLVAAARKPDLAAAATVLEQRATALGDSTEAATLRLRAAQLALDAGEAMRATGLLRQVDSALPGVSTLADLLSVARRRAGDVSGPVRVTKQGEAPSAASPDEFARIVRDADEAAQRGDGPTALSLYQMALDMHPGDPLAAVPLVRVATELREPAAIAALALAQLRAAEADGDGTAKADAYELLSHIDRELRGDAGSAQVALESASQADPARVDLMHRLEREYSVTDQIGELLRLRRAELEQIPAELAADRAAMIMDTAVLSERDNRPDAELTDLYRQALVADPRRRMALHHLEALVRRAGASDELAKLEEQIAAYFEGDPRAQAAFFTRAGETLAELGNIDGAVAMFGRAEAASPGHVPALEGWRSAALKGQLWLDAAEAATRQASLDGIDAAERARLHHFAGVAMMDKALIGDQAMQSFRRALDADPSHRDSFLRMRILLEEEGDHDGLAILIGNRLEHEPEGPSKIELHRALAELSRNFLDDRETAKKHYRAILDHDPNDLRAHSAIADIAWELGAWQEAADALVARARLEHDPEVLRRMFFRLGLIYADHLADSGMALKSFQRSLQYSPDDVQTLERLADLAAKAGEWKLALGACERLVKNEQDPERRAMHLHRVARVFKQGFNDAKRAERALNVALDGAPTSDEALSELVKFYRDAGDMVSVRVHLNRVAGTMRTRATTDPKDGVAYRVIARAMAARAANGVDGSIAVARAAAELATLLGAAGEPERVLLAESPRTVLASLLHPEADDVLYGRSLQPELRQMFTLLGDRVAKHVGVDLRALYGVARGDRLKAKESPVATHAQDVATALGFGEIDVYVSARQPFAMVAEPTSPVSLVIGQSIANLDSKAIRFAAGAALKLAQAHLAIPARLSPEELGVLVVALLRQFQTDFPANGLDEAAIATQLQKLKRLIPTGLANELKPFAYAIDPGSFSHTQLSRELRIAGLRAGLVASGSVVAGLHILAAQAETDVASFLGDPLAQGVITFAVGEDHATLSR